MYAFPQRIDFRDFGNLHMSLSARGVTLINRGREITSSKLTGAIIINEENYVNSVKDLYSSRTIDLY